MYTLMYESEYYEACGDTTKNYIKINQWAVALIMDLNPLAIVHFFIHTRGFFKDI